MYYMYINTSGSSSIPQTWGQEIGRFSFRRQLFGRKLERPGYGILVDWETGKAKEELEIPATLKSKKTVDGRNDVSIDMENLMFFGGVHNPQINPQ